MTDMMADNDFGPDGHITTLHPEGSFNNVRYGGCELIRPEINYTKAAINVLVSVVIFCGICFWDVRIACLLLGFYTLARTRSIMVWFILLYQRYASANTRLACLFEPSCSEYMILSLKKYGVIYGCVKGVNRLFRCRYPNGGEDYP